MEFLPLLGKQLRSDEIVDLLDCWDVEVTYSFDRDHENLPDEYWAPAKPQGIQLVFDTDQTLTTIFIYLIEREGFRPADIADSEIPHFTSKPDVARFAESEAIAMTEGSTEFLGIQRDWIRLDYGAHSIHYEFQDGALGLITLAIPETQQAEQDDAPKT